MTAPLRVALDVQLAVGTATGIGTYQRALLAALRAAGADVTALDAPWLDPWRFDRRVLWEQALLPARLAAVAPAVFHATAGTLPLVRRTRRGRRIPTVVTVHDVAWLRVQRHAPPYARAYFGRWTAARWRGADLVVTDSRFSQDELLATTGIASTVVPLGVDARWAQVARRPDEVPFALAVGTVERRKNLAIVVEALPSVPGLHLIVAGPPTPYLDEVLARARALGVAGRVTYHGYVTPAALDDLVARATVAVVPSRYEGFGYAVAEARCAGVPVVAAASSSLVEVAGPATVLVPSDDPGAWADALRALLADRDAAEARAAHDRAAASTAFAWDAVAARMRALYASVADQ